MTKKDYILIANALRAGRRAGDSAEVLKGFDAAAIEIAAALAADRPEFDRARFLKAAGVEISNG